MNVIDGDLIELAKKGYFDVILHGCNCFCTMGKGIALAIKNEFPDAYKADCATAVGDRAKLGSYSSAEIVDERQSLTVVNAYTQFHFRGKGTKADYEAIRSVMARVKADFAGKRIGYPLIGAGLAGGDWTVIESIIRDELVGEHHTLVRFHG